MIFWDSQSYHLVDVVKQGEKAVFYEPGRWGVVAVPFDERDLSADLPDFSDFAE